MDEQRLAEYVAVANQFAAATQSVDERAIRSAESVWAGFTGWYSAAAVTTVAAQSAAVSQGFQQVTTGSAAEYVRFLLRLFPSFGSVGRVSLEPIRGGVDLPNVHARVASTRKREFALTADDDLADKAAFERLTQVVDADQMLARRQVSNDAMVSAGVKFYRRLIHPELSTGGTCGLCAVASTRVYRSSSLMPIHVRCKCTVMPVAGDLDPAKAINDQDINDNLVEIYGAAGGTSADRLGRLRVKVIQHGEMGPTLVDARHAARNADDVDQQDSPERARRMLARLRPALELIQQRESDGEEMTGQLAYQRAIIARLEQIAA